MDYSDFCMSSRFSIPWNSLKYKYEYGINSDEFSLYQLLVDQVYLLALNLNLNFKLCEALAMAHGFGFCDGGSASWNAVREYFTGYDVDGIRLDIIKKRVKNVKNLADEKFLGYVTELFVGDSLTKEVRLVRQSYEIVKSLQPIKNYDINVYYDLVDKAFKELKDNANSNVYCIDINKYIPIDMPKLESKLNEEEKNNYFNNIKDILEDNKKNHKDDFIYYTIYHLIDE